MWSDGQPFELHVFVTDTSTIDLDAMHAAGTLQSALLWEQQNLRFNWQPQNERYENKSISHTRSLRHFRRYHDRFRD